MASRLGAHIVGVTFELQICSPVGLYAHPAHIGGMFAAESRKSASNARDLIAAFDDICARTGTMQRGVAYEHAIEQCAPAEVAHVLVDHARLRDISIFPLNAEDPDQRSLVEALIFEFRAAGTAIAGGRNAPTAFVFRPGRRCLGSQPACGESGRRCVAHIAGGKAGSCRHLRRRKAYAPARFGR